MTNSFEHAKAGAKADCAKCRGTGSFMYDHNHSTVCNVCCKHDRGFWLLERSYGANNGKWCCFAGCGMLMTFNPDATQ